MHAALATLVAEAPPLRLKDVTGIMALNGEEVWAFVCVFVCVDGRESRPCFCGGLSLDFCRVDFGRLVLCFVYLSASFF